MRIEEKFNYWKNQHTDINEHFETIKKYSSECDIIVEMGVRSIISTWALLAGYPKKLISIDILDPSHYKSDKQEVYDICGEENISWEFVLSDSLTYELPYIDLLFIDTLHTYNQLKKELDIHSSKVKKYIILHDTVSFGTQSADGTFPGLNQAIDEFVKCNDWVIHETFHYNNGLTILKRK